MKKHNIFPVEIYTFENTDLVDPTLDALDPIERGEFNLPSPVQTTRGNLHTLPQFKPLFDWIHSCLDQIQKAEEYVSKYIYFDDQLKSVFMSTLMDFFKDESWRIRERVIYV